MGSSFKMLAAAFMSLIVGYGAVWACSVFSCSTCASDAVAACCASPHYTNPETGEPWIINNSADCGACTFRWCVDQTFFCRKACTEGAAIICMVNDGCPPTP